MVDGWGKICKKWKDMTILANSACASDSWLTVAYLFKVAIPSKSLSEHCNFQCNGNSRKLPSHRDSLQD
eukprot:1605993-Amphidinium_carterae.1